LCPELDEDEIEMLGNILETLADNIDSWEFDYMSQQTTIEKYKKRYEYSFNAFKDLVK
jgi:hypothetical protein